MTGSKKTEKTAGARAITAYFTPADAALVRAEAARRLTEGEPDASQSAVICDAVRATYGDADRTGGES